MSIDGTKTARGGSLAGVAAGIVCTLVTLLPAGQALEGWTEDARFRLRGPRPPTARVAVVAIDDAALDAWAATPTVAMGSQYAVLIEAAREAGASVVALDVIPDFDIDGYLSTLGAPDDLQPNQALADAVLRGDGRVLLGRSGNLSVHDPPLPHEIVAVELGFGTLDLPPLRGGSQRDALLCIEDVGLSEAEGRYRPGIAALLALRSRGDLSWPVPRRSLETLVPGRAQTQTQAASAPRRRTFALNYSLTTPRIIPALRLSEPGAMAAADRDALRDAVVLIGFTNAASPDRHLSPMGAQTPGVLLHAEAVATLLEGRALWRFPEPAPPLVAFGVSLALVFWLREVSTRRAGVVAAGLLLLAAATAGAAQGLFTGTGIVLPLAAPLLPMAAVPMALFAARSREEYRRWHQMREQFDRYVSPAVAEYLMVSEANRRPGGQMGTATCLFLDLRDSVRFGATRPADTVMTDLNEMFAALVPAIQANGGSVFKYTGDGLMAVFNAPVASPEGDIGAQGAVDAARAMHRALAALNQRRWIRWQETRHDPLPDPWFPLVIGIGIHTGLLVFGNLGTADRPEFTVIGDTVNLAARLEALTKPDEINTPTVISDVTYHALRRRPPATDPIMRDIKGHGLIAVRGLTAETETEAVAKLENLPRERQGKLV